MGGGFLYIFGLLEAEWVGERGNGWWGSLACLGGWRGKCMMRVLAYLGGWRGNRWQEKGGKKGETIE